MPRPMENPYAKGKKGKRNRWINKQKEKKQIRKTYQKQPESEVNYED